MVRLIKIFIMFFTLGFILALINCSGEYRIVTPYCPLNDSIKAEMDSIPAICILDSLKGDSL